MTEVLNTIFPDLVVEQIESFLPAWDEDLEWHQIYGTITIFRTKHYLTYGGGPEGGYVYFFRERQPGWYRWHRNWGTEPIYERCQGHLLQRFDEDGMEYVAEVPEDYEYNGPEDNDIQELPNWVMELLEEA
jgi:hypothetical protein